MFSPMFLFVCGTLFLYFVLDNLQTRATEVTTSH